jgi:nicotinamidase-related amidase
VSDRLSPQAESRAVLLAEPTGHEDRYFAPVMVTGVVRTRCNKQRRSKMTAQKKTPLWDSKDCALIFIDYQPEVMDGIHEKDRQLIELNACALARMARRFGIPVILSTVAVKLGVDSPTIAALKAEMPDVDEIDRTSMDAWEDEAFVKAVRATGRNNLVFCGIVTSVCLAFPVIHALSESYYKVAFVADAVGDRTKEEHEMAVLRMVQAGAVPMTTAAMMAEWFRDWASPLAKQAREVYPGFLLEFSKIKGWPAPMWTKKNQGK